MYIAVGVEEEISKHHDVGQFCCYRNPQDSDVTNGSFQTFANPLKH
jgi:hypothetical protein